VPPGKTSRLFELYEKRLIDLNARYFPRNEGSLYIALVKNGREYEVAANDPIPVDNVTEANRWELDAYSERKATYSSVPIVDDTGTYLAAYTPIMRDGRVIGLIAAEYDEAPLSEFYAIIRSTFLLTIIPAAALAVAVAYLLATIFVKPTDVLRAIEERAKSERARSLEEEKNDPWRLLTVREREIAELLRQGVEHTKDIAGAMGIETSTVNTYLKRIRAKTGWSKQRLGIEAMGRRSASMNGDN
jgi:DNA-binding CsgD family transcriptional regulator